MFFSIFPFIRKKMKLVCIQNVTKNDFIGVEGTLFGPTSFPELALPKSEEGKKAKNRHQ